MKIRTAIITIGLTVTVFFLPLVAQGGTVGRAVANGAARSLGKSLGRTTVQAEARALSRVLADLDRGTLAQIERRFGRHLSAERLRAARQAPTQFLPHDRYQRRLREVYPDLSATERQRIVGDLTRRPHVDRNQRLLSRTVAHERLHQLRDPRFRAQVGRGLDEGTTEYLASKVSGDLGIRDLPQGYPAEKRVVQMLSARVGDEQIAKAYFKGEVGALRSSVDGQLGAGAFDKVAKLTAEARFGEAEEILKRGLRSRLWSWP